MLKKFFLNSSNHYLFDELLLYIVLLVGLEEGKQRLFLTYWATTQYNGQTLQQGGLAVK